MMDWPGPGDRGAYVPAAVQPDPETKRELRARIVAARVREGLSVSDEILSQIVEGSDSVPGGPGVHTPSEREDTDGDHERVAGTRAVLADAEDLVAGIALSWADARRAVRVLLTGELDRYRAALVRIDRPRTRLGRVRRG